MTEESKDTQPAAEQAFMPSQVLSEASRRFVARRDGKLEPIMGTVLQDVEARLSREVAEGGKEVDLYVYLGTYRPRRIAEKFDLFAEVESDDKL